MRRLSLFVVVLLLIVLVESGVIVYPLLRASARDGTEHPVGAAESYSFSYPLFNQPITNNSEEEFRTGYTGSWQVTLSSSLSATFSTSTEAELAFAPSYPVEGKSIPTIIVQERADGLLRIEYFAQSWPNTYGLLLYNSTSPGWMGSGNVTIRFLSLGPPSQIDPQIAPRANGNITILIGGIAVFKDYPVAWASLGDVYVYGLKGSSFTGGRVSLTVQAMASS